jgi:hypothetical protein
MAVGAILVAPADGQPVQPLRSATAWARSLSSFSSGWT